MILDLEDMSPQTRYVPDVTGFNFSVLMPDLYSSKGLRAAPQPRPVSLAALGDDCRLQPATATIENLTTGDDSHFQVGDRYRITVHSCVPNASVALNAQFRNLPLPMSGQDDPAASIWLGYKYGLPYPPIGTADSSGTWSTTGTFTAAQAGRWHQGWNMSGQLAWLDFDVYDSNGNLPGDITGYVPTGTALYTLASNHPADRNYTPEELARMAAVPNRPNQSVPPTSQLTTIPSLPAGRPTQQLLATSYASGAGAGSATPGSQLVPGIDNSRLLLGVGLAAVVLMAVKK